MSERITGFVVDGRGLNQDEISIRAHGMLALNHLHSSIVQPDVATNNFEFRPVMFDMLQIIDEFNWFPSEDPHLHLKNFMDVADSFKMQGVTSDALRLNLFPYSLSNGAKTWLNTLPPNSIRRWEDLAEKFLIKFFPPTKAAQLRNDIAMFQQFDGESLYESWDRFKELLWRCPNHGIPEWIQMETFYYGLSGKTIDIVDALSGGALLDKTYTGAYDILERMAYNNYHRPAERSIVLNEAAGLLELDAISSLATYISYLNKSIETLNLTADARAQQSHSIYNVVTCVFCNGPHVYDDCPQNPQSLCFVGNYNMNDSYSNTYNPNWWNHPNFSYFEGQQQGSADATALQDHRPPFQQQHQQQQQQHYQQPEQQAETSDALENQTASIKNLENQMDQLVEAVRGISYETLPNNIEDSRSIGYEQIKVVALKNEKGVDRPEAIENYHKLKEEVEIQKEGDKVAVEDELKEQPVAPEVATTEQKATAKQQHCQPTNNIIRPPPPFLQRLQKQQDDVQESSILCDIEANANLMPMNLLEKMGINSIRSTKMTLQVHSQVMKISVDVVENVMIGNFAHPIDFAVLDMKKDPIISQYLEESCLDTPKVVEDMWKSEMILEIDRDQAKDNPKVKMKEETTCEKSLTKDSKLFFFLCFKPPFQS
ncbi:uncharacterized protein LOC133307117 [Gastrolobium bilobum]|uniref:uncharacterized protein LOC133307117 n=1 Tax=Gastrolobium bilobum TaxID=150636 RepID=UPI002AAFC608|nr:uncharacterized protein LOC133307117 [Gastrolobium bilobum]